MFKILVLDDDSYILEVVQQSINDLGTLHTSHCITDAVIASIPTFDALIIDWHMPEINRVISICDMCEVPYIVWTGDIMLNKPLFVTEIVYKPDMPREALNRVKKNNI